MADPWLGYIGLVISGAFGGSGVLGLLNWWLARKRGASEDTREDDNSVVTQAQAMLQTQFEVFIKPLREDVAQLKSDLKAVERELNTVRTGYWRAIAYVRALLAYIAMYQAPGAPGPPGAPEEILEDV